MSRTVLLLFAVMLLLASCSDKYSDQPFEAIINDSVDLLSPELEKGFLDTRFPDGIAAYLITVDSLDPVAPGVTADELFGSVEDIYPQGKAFKKRGFLVVISRHPSLVQVRAGSKLNNFIRWKGIIAGEEYLDIQRKAYNDSLDVALLSLSSYLEQRLPELDSISWWDKMQYNQAMGLISGEVEEFGYPSDSFYGNYLLKPVLKLRFWELEHFGTWWVTYLLVALIIYVLTRALNFTIKAFTRRMTNKAIQSIILWAFSAGIGLVLSMPALSSAVVLSSGRLEDILALEGLGLVYADIFSLSASSYGMAAPWYLVGLLFLMRLLKGMSGMSAYFTWVFVPDEVQQHNYKLLQEKNAFYAGVVENMATRGSHFEESLSKEEFLKKPYSHAFYNTFNKEAQKAGMWAALAVGFLSKAIVLAAIYLWLFPVLQGFVEYTKRIVKFNRANPQYKIPLVFLVIFPVLMFAVFALFQLMKVYSAYLLVGVLFLMSSGVLLAVVVDALAGLPAGWLLWAVSLSLPAYYVIRLIVALFQTDRKLRRMFVQYVIVTLAAFAVLLYFYLGQSRFDVRGTAARLLPKTERVLKEKTHDETSMGVITVNALNVRQGPGTGYEVVGSIIRTDTFYILDKGDEWWHIRTGEIEGYIHGDYTLTLKD